MRAGSFLTIGGRVAVVGAEPAAADDVGVGAGASEAGVPVAILSAVFADLVGGLFTTGYNPKMAILMISYENKPRVTTGNNIVDWPFVGKEALKIQEP